MCVCVCGGGGGGGSHTSICVCTVSRAVSRCIALQCLSELRCVIHVFSLCYFHGCIAHNTGRLLQPVAIVQGNSLFSVLSQKTCEYTDCILSDLAGTECDPVAPNHALGAVSIPCLFVLW